MVLSKRLVDPWNDFRTLKANGWGSCRPHSVGVEGAAAQPMNGEMAAAALHQGCAWFSLSLSLALWSTSERSPTCRKTIVQKQSGLWNFAHSKQVLPCGLFFCSEQLSWSQSNEELMMVIRKMKQYLPAEKLGSCNKTSTLRAFNFALKCVQQVQSMFGTAG